MKIAEIKERIQYRVLKSGECGYCRNMELIHPVFEGGRISRHCTLHGIFVAEEGHCRVKSRIIAQLAEEE